MTPLKAGCPASSELLRGFSRSQGISGRGVSDGAIWPLFVYLTLLAYTVLILSKNVKSITIKIVVRNDIKISMRIGFVNEVIDKHYLEIV